MALKAKVVEGRTGKITTDIVTTFDCSRPATSYQAWNTYFLGSASTTRSTMSSPFTAPRPTRSASLIRPSSGRMGEL